MKSTSDERTMNNVMRHEYKPLLCLDFDGVIHSYESGWKGVDVIPDPPVPGAIDFILTALEHFEVAIYSARSSEGKGIREMQEALQTWFLQETTLHRDVIYDIVVKEIQWPTSKPPAFLTIDDRVICFNGIWPNIEELKEFKPWNKK